MIKVCDNDAPVPLAGNVRLVLTERNAVGDCTLTLAQIASKPPGSHPQIQNHLPRLD